MNLNPDLMNHIPINVAARDAMSIIDRMQDMPRERQMVALAAVYRLMVERFSVSPHDLHTVADNIMNTAQGRRAEFEAVTAYMEGEL